MKPSTQESINERAKQKKVREARLGLIFHPDLNRRPGMFWLKFSELEEISYVSICSFPHQQLRDLMLINTLDYYEIFDF